MQPAMHAQMHNDRAEQEGILRKLTSNLVELKDMSGAMRDELNDQSGDLERLRVDAEAQHARVRHMNRSGKLARTLNGRQQEQSDELAGGVGAEVQRVNRAWKLARALR